MTIDEKERHYVLASAKTRLFIALSILRETSSELSSLDIDHHLKCAIVDCDEALSSVWKALEKIP